MTTKQKRKGSDFERNAAILLNRLLNNSDFRRVPGSGAMGTTLSESLLMGDLVGKIERFFKNIRVECKTGYSNRSDGEAKSFTLQKSWLDKIKAEAKQSFSFPILVGHFDGVRTGVKTFVAMDVEDFAELVNKYTTLKENYDKLNERIGKTDL